MQRAPRYAPRAVHERRIRLERSRLQRDHRRQDHVLGNRGAAESAALSSRSSERRGWTFGIAARRRRDDDEDDAHAGGDCQNSDAVSRHPGSRALLQHARRHAAGRARRSSSIAGAQSRSETHRGSVAARISLAASRHHNCLPLTADANVDIRLLDDERPEPMLARIRAVLPKDAKLDVLLAGEPTLESPSNTELFRVLVAAMKRAEPGSNAAAVVSAGTSDSRYFRARGIVAYGIAPFKVNYYDANTVHGNDERIRASFFPPGVRLMRQIVNDFCARPSS
ncbi:MAG: hypothetical protein DMF59_03575 [Acidobacteria bacterium]|nr:MAG: hypothetical protein DMF59_03575 [Acidobacteriota bacterium]